MKPFHPYILIAESGVLPCLPAKREVWEGAGLPSCSGLPEVLSWRDASHVIRAPRADHYLTVCATVGCQHRILRPGEAFACYL